MILSNLDSQDTIENENEEIKEEVAQEDASQIMNEDKHQVESEDTSLVADENKNELDEGVDSKMAQFKSIMNQIIMSALKENNGILSEEICTNVTDNVIREMNYLMRLQEEKEEERFRKFDAALREYQKSRLMAAATVEKKKKSKFMKKNKIYI